MNIRERESCQTATRHQDPRVAGIIYPTTTQGSWMGIGDESEKRWTYGGGIYSGGGPRETERGMKNAYRRLSGDHVLGIQGECETKEYN